MDAKLLMMSGAAPFEMYPYDAVNSCRFNAGDSARLSKTPSTGTEETYTISFWWKNVENSADRYIYTASDGSGTAAILITAAGALDFYQYSGGANSWRLATNRLFRDYSAWYHVCIAFDSTQGTEANRVKIYINGVQETSFSAATYPSLNYAGSLINDNSPQTIMGRWTGSSFTDYMNGYLSQFVFIDATAYAASDFGEDKNGIWVPKSVSGLTFGANGFYLDFADSSALGNDVSGNNNDFTSSGLTASDQVIDTPTNNFATLNPLVVTASAANTYANGNLEATTGTTGAGNVTSTMAVPSSGKWYFEFTPTAIGSGVNLGLWEPDASEDNAYQVTPSIAYLSSAYKRVNNSTTSYGATWTTSDVMGVAVDISASTVTFYKNNASQGSISFDASGLLPFFCDNTGGSGCTGSINFGQLGFTYTPPTDHLALCTVNLPEPAIGPNSDILPSEVFAAVLYTGNGTAIGSGGKVITSLGFQPDMVWIKNRDAADSWMVFDSVRGVTKYQSLDSQNVEATDTESLTSFNSNGFSLGSNVAVNTSGEDYVAYCFKITAGFFDIQGYTGTGSAKTEAHDLGVVPQWVTTRVRDLASQNWMTYVESLPVADPATDFIYFDANAAATDNAAMWNDTAPTSSVFTVGTNNGTNSNTKTYIAYLFADVEGFCKVGYHKGNGSTDGPFGYLGFLPEFFFYKRTDSTASWYINDTARDVFNSDSAHALFLDLPNAESPTHGNIVDKVSNGYKARSAGSTINLANSDYITLSIGTPFKYSNAR